VDAIWQVVDLCLDSHRITRDWSSSCDMVAYGAQRMRIEAAIGGRPFTLLAGSHKDQGEKVVLPCASGDVPREVTAEG
jgi:hypothetical protein